MFSSESLDSLCHCALDKCVSKKNLLMLGNLMKTFRTAAEFIMPFHTQCSMFAIQLYCSFVVWMEPELESETQDTICPSIYSSLFNNFRTWCRLIRNRFICAAIRKNTLKLWHICVKSIKCYCCCCYFRCCCCCRFCLGLKKPFFFGSNVKRKLTLFDMKKTLSIHKEDGKRERESEATRYIK